MKNSVISLATLLGVTIFSFPVLGMKNEGGEDFEKHSFFHPLTSPEIVQHIILQDLPFKSVVKASEVCKLWNECIFSPHTFNRNRTEILSLFKDKPYLYKGLEMYIPKIDCEDESIVSSLCRESISEGDTFPLCPDQNPFRFPAQNPFQYVPDRIVCGGDPFVFNMDNEKRSHISLFCLKNVFKKNLRFFPAEKNQEVIICENFVKKQYCHEFNDYEKINYFTQNRLLYTLKFICGSGKDNPIYNGGKAEVYEYRPITGFTMQESLYFISNILKNSINLKEFSLDAKCFPLLYSIDKDSAEILGKAIGNSFVEDVSFVSANFSHNPDALPALLNAASRNRHLKTVALEVDEKTEDDAIDENVINTLMNNVGNNINYILKLPMELTVGAGEEFDDAVNEELRQKLTNHFGEKVKFYFDDINERPEHFEFMCRAQAVSKAQRIGGFF